MSDRKSKKISSIGSRVSTVISVTLVLLIVAFILIATSLTRGANSALRENVAVTLRMHAGASDTAADSLDRHLWALPYVTSVHFTSAENVLQQEMERNSEILELLGENPFSPEFDIYLKPDYVNPDSMKVVVADLEAAPGVESVFSSTEVVDNINTFLQRATLYLSIVGVALLIISIVLIFNTVSLVIYGRRFVIHTMELVGAKASFIRAPFVKSGVWIGVISAAVASAVICGLHAYAQAEGFEGMLLLDWTHTAMLCGMLFALGVAFCALSAFFAANKYIGYSYDSLYMK